MNAYIEQPFIKRIDGKECINPYLAFLGLCPDAVKDDFLGKLTHMDLLDDFVDVWMPDNVYDMAEVFINPKGSLIIVGLKCDDYIDVLLMR